MEAEAGRDKGGSQRMKGRLETAFPACQTFIGTFIKSCGPSGEYCMRTRHDMTVGGRDTRRDGLTCHD